MQPATRLFYSGDPIPSFSCRSSNNDVLFHFHTTAGRYLVLSFFGTSAIDKNAAILKAVNTELRRYFDDDKVSFFGLSIDPEDEKRLKQQVPGIRYFWDFDKKVSMLFNLIGPAPDGGANDFAYHSRTLVIDPFLRVLADIPMQEAETHNRLLADLLSRLPPIDDYAGVPMSAPVLVLPRVFEPEFCRKLIGLYQQHGGRESGYMRERDGKTVPVVNHDFKRRKDFVFDVGEEFGDLRNAVRARLARRVVPAIHKAFQFNVSRIERYVVACYESEVGGFFNPHRDNTTKGTAHRRFACTINLNAEEYEGGDLRFPEFGRRLYRAPTGGAVVFSCSLLHEATPVTRGTRYAFLPFFYDDAAAKIREANAKYLVTEETSPEDTLG